MDEDFEEEEDVEEEEDGAAAFSSSSSFPALSVSFQELQILHKPVRSELTNVHFEHLQDIKVLEVGLLGGVDEVGVEVIDVF